MHSKSNVSPQGFRDYSEALMRETLTEYWLDILDTGSKEEQIRFYKSERGEVDNIEKRLG